jgi:hypothetical protein
MPLESKHDRRDVPTDIGAYGPRIEAYEHVCRAALAAGGPMCTPALLLDPGQLDALFTKQQLEVLGVRRPAAAGDQPL